MEDANRKKAAKLWRSINKTEPHLNETPYQAVSRKLRTADEYVQVLRALGSKDVKLANAYHRIMELQEQAFDSAEDEDHRQRCNCIDEGMRIQHLWQSLAALGEAIKIHICCGRHNHPDLLTILEKQVALQTKELQYERRRR